MDAQEFDKIDYNFTADFDLDDEKELKPTEENSEEHEEEQETEEEEQDLEPTPTEDITKFYSFLTDNEYFITDEGFKFDGTPETFEEAFLQTRKNLKKEVAKELSDKISPALKPVIEYALKGGSSLDEFINQYNSFDYDNLNLSSEEVQKAVIRQYYKESSNYSDATIERLINRLGEDLEATAYETVQELKEAQEKRLEDFKKQQELQENDYLNKVNEIRSSISKSIEDSEYFESARKPKIRAFLFNETRKGKEVDTEYNRVLRQISSNPEHIAQLADILMDYTPKGFSLERLKSKTKTEINKSIKEQLSTKNPIKNTGRPSSKSNKDFDWEEFLKAS